MQAGDMQSLTAAVAAAVTEKGGVGERGGDIKAPEWRKKMVRREW